MQHAYEPSTNVVVNAARKIVQAGWFQNSITVVILAAAALVGVETYPSVVQEYGTVLHALDKIVLGIFTLELVLKMVAELPRPWRYFKDPWNVFDFIIVAACYLPVHTEYATVLRLLRLLRVLRLVHALPRLQILVNALLKSIPSMGYVSLFLLLHFYVYGVAGVFMFGANDPEHFGTLPVALLTLFTVVTMEGWAEVMYAQMPAGAILAASYFISFILLGTMIILNLFIGVIMNGMNEAQEENEKLAEEKAGRERPSLEHEAVELHRQLEELTKAARRLKDRIDTEKGRV